MVDDVVSITPEIHILSLTIFAQEVLVTRNLYELKWYACANYLWVKHTCLPFRILRNYYGKAHQITVLRRGVKLLRKLWIMEI